MPEHEQQEISDDETILRRIPPTDEVPSTQPRPEGGLRATSARIKKKKGETGLSCSRLLQTSPRELLEQLRLDDMSPKGWMVCRIHVADVRALGLDVVYVPADRDPGHCEIRATASRSFSKSIPSILARKTRILTAEEVETLQAGDQLTE